MSLRVAQVAVQHIIANTTNVRSIIRLYSVCARHGGQLSIMADVAKDRANRDISKNVLKNFGKLPYEETQAKNGGNKNKNTLSDGTFDYLGVITRAIRGAGFVKGVSSDALDDMIQIASMWLYQCSINTQENSNLFEKMDPEKPFAPFLAKATFHYVQRAQAQQAKHRQRNTPIEIEKDGESFNILDKLKVETTTFEDKKSEELYKKLVAAILKTLKEKDKEGGTNFAELFGRMGGMRGDGLGVEARRDGGPDGSFVRRVEAGRECQGDPMVHLRARLPRSAAPEPGPEERVPEPVAARPLDQEVNC